ncbi:hypothetical protein [Micromonospora sp. KC213]|uniref:hypothetical protein n=1 Tax=Micromonospora sp. KC213 TaxID=2530378 RepID=UPI0010502E5D|nr:hypothetical protein [Micromonospora sp. KC213]TDC35708.1 hypothetical protein E1166_23210 [Micromonospora sp. KC213]
MGGTQADRNRRIRPALDVLRAVGCEVVCPGHSPVSATADDLLSVINSDLDALADVDAVVALPETGRLWEYTMAGTLGIPVLDFAGCAAVARSA